MNSKKIIAIVVVLVIFGTGGFAVWRLLFAPRSTPVTISKETRSLPQVDDSVQVAVRPRNDNNAVFITVQNIPDGTESIDYELSYITAEGLPKGAVGKIRLSGESEAEEEVLLGTCSRNVCTYDEGVTAVDVVLKFNHSDGDSQFQGSFDL